MLVAKYVKKFARQKSIYRFGFADGSKPIGCGSGCKRRSFFGLRGRFNEQVLANRFDVAIFGERVNVKGKGLKPGRAIRVLGTPRRRGESGEIVVG